MHIAINLTFISCAGFICSCSSGGPAPPEAPGQVLAGPPFDLNAVVVSWNYEPGETVTVRIERSITENGPWELAGEVRASAPDEYLIDTGLCPGDRLWYRLFAERDSAISAPSATASGIAGDVMPGLPAPEPCISGAEAEQ